MTPNFDQVRSQAKALPLTEQLSLAAELIEAARDTLSMDAPAADVRADRATLIRESIGSMRGKLSTVDEFLREKHAELEREETRDAARLRRDAA